MTPWTAKAERGSTLLITFIIWLARRVGRPFCRLLLFPIVLYFFCTDKLARSASAEFLTHALARPATWRDVFRHIYCFAATLLDRVYFADGAVGRFELKLVGDDILFTAIARGQGCLLLCSHLGSFDAMALANRAFKSHPVHAMMRFDPRARLRQLIGIDDSNTIPLGQIDSFLRGYEILEAGGILAVMADRADGATRLLSHFFGHTAHFPRAPFRLAQRSQAAVVAVFAIFEGGKRYRIEFIDMGTLHQESEQVAVDRYVKILEDMSKRYPYNWFNFFPFWTP